MSLILDLFRANVSNAVDDGMTETGYGYPGLVCDLSEILAPDADLSPDVYRAAQNEVSKVNGASRAFPHLMRDISDYCRMERAGKGDSWQPYVTGQQTADYAKRAEQATQQPKNGEQINMSGGETISTFDTLYSRAGLLVALIAAPALIIGLYLYYNRKDWKRNLWAAAGLFALVALLGGYAVYYMMLRAYEVVV